VQKAAKFSNYQNLEAVRLLYHGSNADI